MFCNEGGILPVPGSRSASRIAPAWSPSGISQKLDLTAASQSERTSQELVKIWSRSGTVFALMSDSQVSAEWRAWDDNLLPRAGTATCSRIRPYPAPDTPLARRKRSSAVLPDATLIDQVRRLWNGIPAALQRESAVLEMILPTLRADLAVGETYVYRDEAPLACPISCFGGRDDATLTPSDLAEWRQQTAAGFHLQMFPGGHFFLKSAQDALLRVVAWDLTTDRRATPSPPLDRSPAMTSPSVGQLDKPHHRQRSSLILGP
jgi:thioesterase superfamily protein